MALGALPPPAEKAAAVRAMFDRIADRYDRLNALLTFGLDRGWRRSALAAARLAPGDLLVDVACGTGDFLAEAAELRARAVGVDFAARMLAGARRRGVPGTLLRADAGALPLRDRVADAVTCGFALRNFVAIPPVLAEAARVLRPGGRLVLLEVATPEQRPLRWMHQLYFHRLVPLLGGVLADPDAYTYLPQSVAYLPSAPALRAMIAAAGFDDVAGRPLALGAVQLLIARRSAT